MATLLHLPAHHKLSWHDAAQHVCRRRGAGASNRPARTVDPADYYCQVGLIEDLAGFGQRLFTGIGYPRDVPPSEGFSWSSYHSFYADFLKSATRLPTSSLQIKWLAEAVDMHMANLRLMSELMRTIILTSEPAVKRLGIMLPHDAPQVVLMRAKLVDQETWLTLQGSIGAFTESTNEVQCGEVDPYRLPLLSSQPRPGDATHKPSLLLSPARGAARAGPERERADRLALQRLFPGHCSFHLLHYHVHNKRKSCARGANFHCMLKGLSHDAPPDLDERLQELDLA